jgi:homoserine kinase type II
VNNLPDLAAYDLEPPVEVFQLAQGRNNSILGVRTGEGEYVWKESSTYQDPESVLYEHRLLSWLAEAGLPFAVPAPVADGTGDTLQSTPRGFGVLFPLLPGERPGERDTRHTTAVGAALGELHAALSRYPVEPRPGLPVYGDLEHLHERIPNPFGLAPEQLGLPDTPEYGELFGWWREMLEGMREFVERTYLESPWQVIHGDFLPGNTLVLQDRVSAVLDFEFSSPDARAMDLASGLEFAVDVLENPDPWPVARAFCRGYASRARLTEEEVAAVPRLILLRDATSAVWWLGRNLDAGGPGPDIGSIARMRGHEAWLRHNGSRLTEVLMQEMEGDTG